MPLHPGDSPPVTQAMGRRIGGTVRVRALASLRASVHARAYVGGCECACARVRACVRARVYHGPRPGTPRLVFGCARGVGGRYPPVAWGVSLGRWWTGIWGLRLEGAWRLGELSVGGWGVAGKSMQ